MSKRKDYYGELASIAAENGMSVFGTAEIEDLKTYFHPELASLAKGLPRAVSIGYRLSGRIIDGITDAPTQLYAFHYKRVNILLDEAALRIAGYIHKEGFSALPVPASQTLDREQRTAHLSHKMIAVAAGLGWIGRNILVVNPEFGARVRYATVLTDIPVSGGGQGKVKDPKRDAALCGECRECVEACPVKAIGRTPAEFNLELCSSKLKEFSARRGIGHHICGICVKACRGRQEA